ncbi:hypothetical protein AB5N19_04115 [Seiridium cardinale]
MERLSPELLHIVVSFLDVKDRRQFRLVNKNFSVIAAAHIIPEVSLHLHAKDLEKLRAIAAHGTIARNVQSLTYFAARLESPPISFAKYSLEHHTCMQMSLVSPALTERRRWKMDLTPEQLRAHYEMYLETVSSQDKLVANQADLVCLKEVLPSFTGLRCVTMSSGHHFYEGVINKPKSPYDDCVRDPHEDVFPAGASQCEVLLESLAYHGTKIEQFRAGAMSWRFFDKEPEVISRLFSALGNLKYTELVLMVETDENGEDVTDDTIKCRDVLERRGVLKTVFKSMPNLEVLGFAIQGDFESHRRAASLDSIIPASFHWPNLSDLSLEGVDCRQGALLKFLELHHKSLSRVCLQDVTLTDGSWKPVLRGIRSKLYLQEACICGLLCGYIEEEEGGDPFHDPDRPTEFYDLWTADRGPNDMRNSINCYCRRGGEDYPDELPLTRDIVNKYFESHVHKDGILSESEDEEEMRKAELEVDARIRAMDLFHYGEAGLDDTDDDEFLSLSGADEEAFVSFFDPWNSDMSDEDELEEHSDSDEDETEEDSGSNENEPKPKPSLQEESFNGNEEELPPCSDEENPDDSRRET